MLRAAYTLVFRTYRFLRGRDNCETCDGTTNVRGNENIVDGVVMCDDCSVRYSRPRCDRRRVVQAIRKTIAINRGQTSEVVMEAMTQVANLIERGDVGRA